MTIEADVSRLVAESLAAHTRMLQGSNARSESRIITEARKALAALLGALALDPTRTLPVWHGLPPRDQKALSDRMIVFYQQLDADGVAEGL
jgi:hypothetical protein